MIRNAGTALVVVCADVLVKHIDVTLKTISVGSVVVWVVLRGLINFLLSRIDISFQLRDRFGLAIRHWTHVDPEVSNCDVDSFLCGRDRRSSE